MFNQAMEFLYGSEFHDFGIMIFDHNFHIVFSNKKAKLLYPATEGAVLSPETNLHSILRLCMEQQKTLSGYPLHESAADTLSSLALYAYPINDTSTDPFLFVIILEINSLYQYYKRLSSHEKLDLIGKMAAATANVILNPLAVIKGMLQLMEQHLNAYAETMGLPFSPVHNKMQGYFQTIQKEINTINRHIQRFIIIGKTSDISLSRIQIMPYLDRIVPAFRMKALEKELRFICEYPAADGIILGHPAYLEEALQALLQNALEATNPGRAVIFRTEITEEEVRFFMIDHGEGIPPDIISQIGDPFVTTKGEALGLGLSYSYQIIEKMGGSLKFRSLPEGTQARISFTRVE